MEVQCSNCDGIITKENINVQKDTAYCEACGSLSALSKLVSNLPDNKFNITDEVKGVSFNERLGNWSIDASYRSLYALFIVPFTCVWAGGSLSGIYGSQLVSGNFSLEKSLFGLPFLIGSIVLVTISLMTVFGRTVVSSENGKGLVFIGLGNVGWYRRFEWNDVSDVIEKQSHQYSYISLEGKRRLNFGWGLSGKKRYFIANAIRHKLNT